MLWACLDAFRIRVWANTAGSTHFSRCAHQQAVSSLTWNLRAAARSPITGAQALTFSFISELWLREPLAADFTALDSTLIVRHHPGPGALLKGFASLFDWIMFRRTDTLVHDKRK